jgi:hypothetical protein
MSLQNYALVDSTGTVQDICRWDGTSAWAPPTGLTAIADPAGTAAAGWTYSNGAFTAPVPTLAKAQSAQSTALSSACQAAITAGFTSSTLGSAYSYGCSATDQANVAAVAANASGGALWCASGSPVAWGFEAHTQAQAEQVRTDMLAHIQAQQMTYAGLLGKVAAATTVSAVQAVVW